MDSFSTFSLLESSNWRDYALLDSGDGLKLERFATYTFVRPEVQAMWKPALSEKEWASAHGIFQPMNEESGGHWAFKKKVPERWEMAYHLKPGAASPSGAGPGKQIRFWAMTTPGRHLGVFPEAAAHWDFIQDAIEAARRPVKILNLFGYTGLASLVAAATGGQVTHVDASRKSVNWARANQALSKLDDLPIRWIVDDALKFVQREGRRGVHYDAIILDPPKFGRGPKGEVWEIYKSLPQLLQACRAIMTEDPIFVIVTVYAVKASAIHLAQALSDMTSARGGTLELGELVAREQSARRLLSQAVFARWSRSS